jgi:hypothetical protein
MFDALDEDRLQRLVDGELDCRQRREFLASLDETPGHWREVALAFVEDQIWKTGVRSALDVSDHTDKLPPVTASGIRHRFSSIAWIAAASALVVALFVGFRLGELRQRNRMMSGQWPERQHQVSADHLAASQTPSQQADVAKPIQGAPAYRLVFHTGGRMIDLPVYDESLYQNTLWIPPENERIDSLNRRLEQLGYRLEYEADYLRGSIDENRELVVPVRNVAMQYHGQ